MADLHLCLPCLVKVVLLFDCSGALISTVAKRNVVVIHGFRFRKIADAFSINEASEAYRHHQSGLCVEWDFCCDDVLRALLFSATSLLTPIVG